MEWYPGFYCLIVGMLFDDQLYASSFISGAVYILKSLKIQFSMCQLTESACVIFSLSIHILRWSSRDIGYNKKRNYWFFNFILCQLELERPCDFIRTLTRLYRRSHRRYNCVFRFSTALRGGKPAAAAALIGGINCNSRLSSALRGGKLAVAALPPLS